MNELKPPRRACRLVLDMQADDRKALAGALFNLAHQIETGQSSKGVSGGYSSGYIYELVENDQPSHDEWYKDLKSYLEALDAEKTTVRQSSNQRDEKE
jgi:hypothetical protein